MTIKEILQKDNVEESFYPSLHNVKKYSKIINEELFDGELSKVDYIDIRGRRGKWAKYSVTSNGDTLLSMHNKYKSKKFFIEVLAHELIHHWQWTNGHQLSHGKTFKLWKPKFKEKGLLLQVSYR